MSRFSEGRSRRATRHAPVESIPCSRSLAARKRPHRCIARKSRSRPFLRCRWRLQNYGNRGACGRPLLSATASAKSPRRASREYLVWSRQRGDRAAGAVHGRLRAGRRNDARGGPCRRRGTRDHRPPRPHRDHRGVQRSPLAHAFRASPVAGGDRSPNWSSRAFSRGSCVWITRSTIP